MVAPRSALQDSDTSPWWAGPAGRPRVAVAGHEERAGLDGAADKQLEIDQLIDLGATGL